MIAVVQDSELFSTCKNLLETDAALIVQDELGLLLTFLSVLRMVVFALLPIFAVSLLEEFTNGEVVLMIQEVINDIVIVNHVVQL